MGRGAQLVGVAAGLVTVAVAAAGVVFVVGMRRHDPRVQDRVRRFNRDVTNPRQLHSAGTADSGTAVIVHAGRRSGRVYETPIGVEAVDDGFVVALPYGEGADWVRNVLAADGATLRHRGREIAVTDPALVPTAEVRDAFSLANRLGMRVFGVQTCLHLRTAEGS